MPGIVALDHIQIAMPPGQEATARQFYGTILGLEEVAKPNALADRGGCWFIGPATAVHLGVEVDFQPARKAHPAFRVHDLAAFQAHLEANAITTIPDALLPHVRRFYVHDPFGNRIEFLQDGDFY